MKNKKQFFNVLIVGLFAIALLIGCSNNADNSNGNVESSQKADTEHVSAGSENSIENGNEFDTESISGTEELESTEETEMTEETETEEKDLPKAAEGELPEEESILKITPTDDDVNNGSGSNEKEVFTAPAAASKKNPIIKAATTASATFSSGNIPAGKTWYYKVTAPKGYYFCIEDTDAKIACGKEESKIESGKVLLKIQDNESEITIKNSGKQEKFFTVSIVKMEDLFGTAENPYIIDSVATTEDAVEPIEVSFLAGDTDGYYYEWKAKQDGKLDVTVSAEDDEKIDVIITVNGEKTILSDDGVETNNGDTKTATVTVAKGNKVTIQVIAKKDEDTYPAVKGASFKLRCRVAGTAENPIELAIAELPESITDIKIPAGKTYFEYIRNLGGTQLTVESTDIKNLKVHQDSDVYESSGEDISLTLAEVKTTVGLGSFVIENTGTTEASCTLKFEYVEGSSGNPSEIVIEGGNSVVVSHTFKAGEDSYCYQWKAPAAGTMKFDISATTDVAWQYSIVCETKNILDDTSDSVLESETDRVTSTKEYEIESEDIELNECVFIIKVNTYAVENQATPAGTISFTLTFNEVLSASTVVSSDAEAGISEDVVENTEIVGETEVAETTEIIEDSQEIETVEAVLESTENEQATETIEATESDGTFEVREPIALRVIRNWCIRLFSR